MKYSIVYSSKTGNTEKLAEIIKEDISVSDLIYYGEPDLDVEESDLIFVGFWTDKGTCDDKIVSFLKTLQYKNIFLFGTAGFSGSQEYFNQILSRVRENIGQNNKVIGTYMCVGRMPDSLRKRYESMGKENPEKMQAMIENFDKALPHPDRKDLDSLKCLVLDILKNTQ